MKQNSGKFWLNKKMPQTMKDKMRNAKIGDKNPSKRLDVRKKLRNAKLGKPSNSKGHKLLEEVKRKMGESKKGENNPNWQGGISFEPYSTEPYSTDWIETLRRSIRERDHYVCQLCFQYGNA